MDKKKEMMKQTRDAMELLDSIATNLSEAASILNSIALTLMSDEDSTSSTK